MTAFDNVMRDTAQTGGEGEYSLKLFFERLAQHMEDLCRHDTIEPLIDGVRGFANELRVKSDQMIDAVTTGTSWAQPQEPERQERDDDDDEPKQEFNSLEELTVERLRREDEAVRNGTVADVTDLEQRQRELAAEAHPKPSPEENVAAVDATAGTLMGREQAEIAKNLAEQQGEGPGDTQKVAEEEGLPRTGQEEPASTEPTDQSPNEGQHPTDQADGANVDRKPENAMDAATGDAAQNNTDVVTDEAGTDHVRPPKPSPRASRPAG